MKILTTFVAIFLMAVGVFIACKKSSPSAPPPPLVNQPPVARAGADVSITLTSCAQVASIDLDGSGSTDPEFKSLSYSWRKILGPAATLLNTTSAKARAANMGVGEYAFELSVRDVSEVSIDTMVVSIKPATPKEYDLDITINDSFRFHNDYKDCYYSECTYTDIITINAKGTFLPLGEFSVSMSEYADSAAAKYASSSSISIYNGGINTMSIYGSSSVNLKKLIQQGGGPFNGTFTVTGGSVTACDPKLLNNLPALNVTGNLDTTTRKILLRVYGKAYF